MNGLLFVIIYSLLCQVGEVLPSPNLTGNLPNPSSQVLPNTPFGNAAISASKIDVGWTIDKDQKLGMIVQISPDAIAQFAEGYKGQELPIDIPPEIQNRVQKVIFRVGTLPVERIPANPQLLAANRTNNNQSPFLADLNGRSQLDSRTPVNIDRTTDLMNTAGGSPLTGNGYPPSNPPPNGNLIYTQAPDSRYDEITPNSLSLKNKDNFQSVPPSSAQSFLSKNLPNVPSNSLYATGQNTNSSIYPSGGPTGFPSTNPAANPSATNYPNPNYQNTQNGYQPTLGSTPLNAPISPPWLNSPNPAYNPNPNYQPSPTVSQSNPILPSNQSQSPYATTGSSYLASTSPFPYLAGRNSATGRSPTVGGYDESLYDDPANPKQDNKLLPFLLLFSIVGNVYLGLWMSHLRTRYRQLLGNMRGIPVSDLDN